MRDKDYLLSITTAVGHDDKIEDHLCLQTESDFFRCFLFTQTTMLFSLFAQSKLSNNVVIFLMGRDSTGNLLEFRTYRNSVLSHVNGYLNFT